MRLEVEIPGKQRSKCKKVASIKSSQNYSERLIVSQGFFVRMYSFVAVRSSDLSSRIQCGGVYRKGAGNTKSATPSSLLPGRRINI